jgi:Mlc titration factor MtfA (ptsG expression regulator)
MWKEQQRKKLQSTPLSSEWKRIVETRCPFYHLLPEPDRTELEGHIQVFMAEKKFEGCGGLDLNDEIRVCIAAHACLLLLHRDADYYPGLKTILVYPNTYFAPTTRHIGSGVMEESHQPRAGESWREGAVVLSWDAICNGILAPESGYNVVLHEFAHQLDYEDGQADGVPLLGKNESYSKRKNRYATWRRVMGTEYERLRVQVQRGESTVLREYGATNPAEFFAVATEAFFGKPLEMLQILPALYDELKWYYRQDPTQWNREFRLKEKGNVFFWKQ